MSEYQNGKIYEIVSEWTDMKYVGSTILDLKERFKDHVGKFERYLRGEANFFGGVPLFEFGDAKIVLIENFPCNSEEELNQREQFYIDLFKNLIGEENVTNIRAAYTGIDRNLPKAEYKKQHKELNKERYQELSAQYYADHRETIKERSTQYYLENKEAVNRYKSVWGKQQFECECGTTCRWGDKSKHFKTKKHRDFVASQNNQ